MKALALAFLLSLSLNIQAQCALAKNTIDEFTNNRIVKTDNQVIFSDLLSSMSVSYMIIDSTYYLTFGYSRSSIWSVSQDDQLMFKMDDTTFIKVSALSSVVADPFTLGSATTWSGTVDYVIDRQTLEAFCSKGVVKIRFYTSEGYIEKDIKPRRTQEIKEIAACLKNNI